MTPGKRVADGSPDVGLLSRVLRTFGIRDDVLAIGEVGRAWSNRVWSVRTTHGRFAIKELLNPWDDSLWRDWLAEAMSFERKAIDAGVRAPRVVVAPDGAALVSVEGRHFRAHEWVSGAQPCPAGPVPVALAESIAKDLALMHALRVTPVRHDVFPTPSAAVCEGWPSLVRELRRRDSSYATAAARVAGDVDVIGEWFAQRAVSGDVLMSHGDVDQKNLLLSRDRAWLVDWDVAMPWRPQEDALRTAMSLADWRAPSVARAFLAAYSTLTGSRVELSPTAVASDLLLGVAWLDRCLRIAAGMLPAPPERRAEARQHATADLGALPGRVSISRELTGWLSTSTPIDL